MVRRDECRIDLEDEGDWAAEGHNTVEMHIPETGYVLPAECFAQQ